MQKIINSIQFIGIFLSVTVILIVLVVGVSIVYYRSILRKGTSLGTNQIVRNENDVTVPEVLGAEYIPEEFFSKAEPTFGINAFLIGDAFQYFVLFNEDLLISSPFGANSFSSNCEQYQNSYDIECSKVLFEREANTDTSRKEIHYFPLGQKGVEAEYTLLGWDVKRYQDVYGYFEEVKVPITFFKSSEDTRNDEYFGCIESICFIFEQDGRIDLQLIMKNIMIRTSTESERENFVQIVQESFESGS